MATRTKARTAWVCTECGYDSIKWFGQCPSCKQYNTMKEIKIADEPVNRYAKAEQTEKTKLPAALAGTSEVLDLSELTAEEAPRILIGMAELERSLGGGFVPGSVILIGGDPGIGKSTLLLQAMCKMTGLGQSCLYASGEESPMQVALRAKRLEVDTKGLKFISEIQLEKIERIITDTSPQWVVIDSIQTMFSDDLSAAPCSISQVKECAARLTRIAKRKGIGVIFVGHVTKEGAMAGPRVLEHMVDTVLYFEGDTESNYRILRACKNRFGSVNEIGVFGMTDKGLRGVRNPSAMFLAERREGVPGSVTFINLEGTRPILIEIQALVDKSMMPNPKRLTVGTDAQRLTMLLAILHRHVALATYDQDVFLNAVGGIKITETASDLAVLTAIVSSMTNRAVSAKTAVFGEVGLGGEIRPVSRGQERIKEASKLGFTRIIVPSKNVSSNLKIQGVEVIGVSTIREAVKVIFSQEPEHKTEEIVFTEQ
ncbi:MAG: DNA repair protein RadA [Burkholderiales bacterium]|nr:DNA repair protein RadA [Burkholderiales bacterium]